jgi:uncharacterized protein with ParB-like and HNH nuclease domain
MNDNKINVKPDTIYLEDLLDDIADGKYRIPVFQRDFVWKSSQILELFDSILKGYPIGSLLFWNTKEEYKIRKEIGPYTIKDNDGENTKYVLDGFQRISTLFGVLTNPHKHEQNNIENLKIFSIFFNVKENNFIVVKNKKDSDIFSIPLYMIYDNRELFNIIRSLDAEDITETNKEQYIDNARNLHDILHKYKIPFVEIKGGKINDAVEIFSRVNSTGTEISEDFMLSALTYNIDTGFLLSDSITEFLNSLNTYNFEDLKRDTVLNCISNAQGSIYFDIKIEDLLNKALLPDLGFFVNNAYIHIRKAVEFLYKKIFVLDIRLLPYPTQLIFISEYFRINPNPTIEQINLLENWFWTTTYSNYFTLYSLSQQRSAYHEFCDFAKGNSPDGIYKMSNDIIFTTAKYPEKLNFAGVRQKALQLFYLKTIIANGEIQDKEGIKEIFISTSSRKDKSPANIILRLSSEFEEFRDKKQINAFIQNSSAEILDRHFITQEMTYLLDIDVDEFISEREVNLKLKERDFVGKLKIRYIT